MLPSQIKIGTRTALDVQSVPKCCAFKVETFLADRKETVQLFAKAATILLVLGHVQDVVGT
jgi:hypothetical protein